MHQPTIQYVVPQASVINKYIVVNMLLYAVYDVPVPMSRAAGLRLSTA